MDDFALWGGLAGGVGLFLLGMGLMTDGLKLAAGTALERFLARSTQTRWHGLLSGVLITALVQSSSAVTVATIGFVNAGLLTLSQALWVMFGANVGTTMTGWLVALVGLEFKIDLLALPLVGLGAILNLIAPDKRLGAAGKAMAGFGVLFLGIDILKDTFTGLAASANFPSGHGSLALLLQVGTGIVLTVLMQSSSAALAIALTAAQGGMLTPTQAAAVVIGANIGTTVTALIAVIGATPNAKRTSAAHVIFNLLTGCVALLLLPWLIQALQWLSAWLGLGHTPAAQLALFHTLFNVLGLVLIWPWADQLTSWLESRFQVASEGAGRPLFIDKNTLAVPALALDALEREVRHVGDITFSALRQVLTGQPAAALLEHKVAAAQLNRAIANFIVALSRSALSADSAELLPSIMRAARYFESVMEQSLESARALTGSRNTHGASTTGAQFLSAALHLLELCSGKEGAFAQAKLDKCSADLEIAYQAYKVHLLHAGTGGQLPVLEMDAMLRSASSLRRALQQAAKGTSMLHSLPNHMSTSQPAEGLQPGQA